MIRIATVLAVVASVLGACAGGSGADLTVYSGRSEELVGPLITRFEESSGLDVEVRYAGSTELAATLLEEGDNTPADVFFAQDPASLGVVALEQLFRPLPAALLGQVPARFSDRNGRWVGVSGRARVLVHGADAFDDPPATVDDLTAPEWEGRLAIAPQNGSFLAFVAAKILLDGEPATRDWLEGIAANDPVRFDGNSAIVAAVDGGEVDAGLVNHYYLLRLIDEQGSSRASNLFFDEGGAGALVMPAGAGILAAADDVEAAIDFVSFLLSEEAQSYFAAETFEYPLLAPVAADPALPPLETIGAPDLDLSRLAEALDAATDLVAETGLL